MEQVLIPVTVVLWAAGFLLLPRLQRLRATPSPSIRKPISVIIPAVEETHVLSDLLSSPEAQNVKVNEIIIVARDPSDQMAALAREHGAELVRSQPLPDGWEPTAWACHQAVRTSTSELLLFLDPNSWFEQSGMSTVLATYRSGALSVRAFQVLRKPWENLSLFFNLLTTFATVPDGPAGQLLLVERGAYLRVGGHKAVKNLVPHNLHLWKKLRDGGIPVRTVTGKSTLFFHMPAIQFKELIRTCTRVCTLELRQAPKIVFTVMLAWIAGLALAPVCLLAAPDRLVGLFVYAVCALQVGWLAQQVGSYHWFAAMIYPVPLLFFLALSACSIAYRTKKKS